MSRYVFPSPRNNLPMSIDTPRTTIRKLTHTDYTMHGFRSTFRDWGEENFNHDTLLACILKVSKNQGGFDLLSPLDSSRMLGTWKIVS